MEAKADNMMLYIEQRGDMIMVAPANMDGTLMEGARGGKLISLADFAHFVTALSVAEFAEV